MHYNCFCRSKNLRCISANIRLRTSGGRSQLCVLYTVHRDQEIHMQKDDVVIVGMARTPIGDFMGELASVSAPKLGAAAIEATVARAGVDRKSTRLNSSHSQISYAVFCLKKKNKYE